MKQDMRKNIGLGAVAGAVGTAVIRGMMTATERFAPETLPPMKQDPGKFMIKQAKRVLPERMRAKVPEELEEPVAGLLAFGYGMTFASVYAATRPRLRNTFVEGAALGAATWAAGSLGWLPATKLSPPVWKQKPKQVIPNILSHLIFGIVSLSLLGFLRKRF